MRHRSLLAVLLVALATSGFINCPQTPNDAGDIAWAHQTIPLIMGRKARGVAELNAVAGLVAQHDRATVADAMFQQEEFVDYWTTVMVDVLGVRKSGFLSHPSDCYNDAALADDDVVNLLRLADHLRTAPTSEVFMVDLVPVDWTMRDAIRAAILDDDLTVAYLAYLLALEAEHEDLIANQAPSITDQFREYYLDRNIGCTSCHSSHVSHVDPAYQTAHGTAVWDRHFPSEWNLDSSVVGGKAPTWGATPPQPHKDRYVAGETYFTNNCAGCHGAAGLTLMNGYLKLQHRIPMLSDDGIIGAIGQGAMAGVAVPAGVNKTNLLAFLRHRFGGLELVNKYFQRASVVIGGANRPWGMADTCAAELVAYSIPDGEPPVSFADSSRRQVDVRDLARDLRDGMEALPAELVANPGDLADESYALGMMDGQAAFAMMVARRAANAVAKETGGARLVVDHGFSRNLEQGYALSELARTMVVSGVDRTRLSLRMALRQVLVLPQYNQLPPSQYSGADYPFWMLMNPWVAEPNVPADTSTGVNTNGTGDNVHRFTATSLLWSTRESLGWGEPFYFALAAQDGTLAKKYPRRDYLEDIGGRISDDVRGSDFWDLQTLLYWESVAGTCGLTPTGVCVPSQSGDCVLRDWIDDVMQASTDGTVTPAPTLRELLQVTRDRLIADPLLPADEETELSLSLLPVGATLDTVFPVDPALHPAWEDTLRHYCGALMTSPQYTMAGLVTVTSTPAPGTPRFTVCQAPSELCTETDLCNHHAGYITAASTCP